MSKKIDAVVMGESAGRGEMKLYDPNALEIVTDKSDPLYDERVTMPLDQALVANIAHFGVLEPVLCTKRGTREDGTSRILVVAGRQRVRAARAANEELKARGEAQVMVPVIMKRAEDSELASIAVSENEQRTADNPIVKARKMQRLIDLGRSVKDVCLAFGCSEVYAKAQLKLLETDKSVQKALEKGTITRVSALEIVKLPHEEQAKKVPQIEAEYAPTAGRGSKKMRRGAGTAKGKRTGKSAATGAPITAKGLGRKQIEWLALGFKLDKATPSALAFEKAKPSPEAYAAASCILAYVISGNATKLPKVWVELAAVAHHKAKSGAEPGAPEVAKSEPKAAE